MRTGTPIGVKTDKTIVSRTSKREKYPSKGVQRGMEAPSSGQVRPNTLLTDVAMTKSPPKPCQKPSSETALDGSEENLCRVASRTHRHTEKKDVTTSLRRRSHTPKRRRQGALERYRTKENNNAPTKTHKQTNKNVLRQELAIT